MVSTPRNQRNVYFVSLGCPKNQVDTEVMLGHADRAGYQRVDVPEEADIIVVNTCGFIDAAKEESVDTILEMAEYKRGRCTNLVVTGCLSQGYPDELAAEIPEIDHISGSADFARVAEALEQPRRGALPIVSVSQTPTHLYDHNSPRVTIGKRHSVYVKIAEGCDRPCAFCNIPNLRGAQRSRTVASVVAEVHALVAAGAKEINLIAQDLTRYGVDLPAPHPTLAQLLRAVAQVPGLCWVRLHYTYPSAFTDELIDVIAEEPTIAKYIDVPLQHIDDTMLKRMRRGHTAQVTRDLIARLRSRIDGVVLRTTFIVGHPGETEAAFAELCGFVEETRFERVGVFPYSIEPGTVSALLPHRVSTEVAAERCDQLMALQAQISRTHNEAMIGSEIEVLVEGLSDETDLLLQGRWYGQAPDIDGTVYLTDGTAQPGDFVAARVTDCADHDLAASMDMSMPAALEQDM